MKNYTYYPMAMHLHACNQLGASMESHMYNAHLLGMRYIHFTPHDIRTGPKKVPYNTFDFSQGTLVIDGKYGWQEVYGSPEVSFEDGCMVLSASSDSAEYEASGYGYKSSGKSHTVNLMAETSLCVGFKFEAVGDARLVLDVRLSQRPPDHKEAHLR
nr:hypothetical protein [Clostridia bacterium]